MCMTIAQYPVTTVALNFKTLLCDFRADVPKKFEKVGLDSEVEMLNYCKTVVLNSYINMLFQQVPPLKRTTHSLRLDSSLPSVSEDSLLEGCAFPLIPFTYLNHVSGSFLLPVLFFTLVLTFISCHEFHMFSALVCFLLFRILYIS